MQEWPRRIDYEGMNRARAANEFLAARPFRLVYSEGKFYTQTQAGEWQELSENRLQSEFRQTDPDCILDVYDIPACMVALVHLTHVESKPAEGVPFRNGMVNAATGELNSADGFFGIVPDFDYDPDAECPHWERYLGKHLDGIGRNVLQEFFGLCLTSTPPAVRCLSLIGYHTALIERVAAGLVGAQAVLRLTVGELGERFALADLASKRLVIVTDYDRKAGSLKGYAAQRLLDMASGSRLTVQRKFKAASEVQAPRFMLASTYVLNSTIAAHAVAVRVKGGEIASDLAALIAYELPGIVNWALGGLRRVNEGADYAHFVDE